MRQCQPRLVTQLLHGHNPAKCLCYIKYCETNNHRTYCVLSVLMNNFFTGHVPECDCLVVRAAEKLTVVDAKETTVHRSNEYI